jgi:hypothetical protein
MEIYDLYYDAFNLGDIRNSLKEGEVIEDPSSGDKYKVVDVDNIGEYVVIERIDPNFVSFKEYLEETRMYMEQEYMVQYCEWDETIKKFESLIDFFSVYEYPFYLPDSSKGSWGYEDE